MKNWAEILRNHACAIEAASRDFKEFVGTDSEDHCETLLEASRQFREDAEEYEKLQESDQ